MRQGVLTAYIVILLAGHVVTAAPDTAARDKESGAVKAPAAQLRDSSEQAENSLEAWAHKTAGPWIACAILGTYRYAQYLLDKSDRVNFVLFSSYLETGDCFYRDLEWAADIYREGAKAGKEVYALYLGYLYLKGLGVKRDVKEARRWFDLGALYQITADKKYQINHTKWIMDHRGMPPELMDAIERGRKKLDGDGADIKRVARWLRIGIHGMTQNDAAAAELDRIARSAKNRPRLSSNDHFQRQFRYYKTLLANGFGTRDPEKRKIEIYRALDGIYNHASMGRHAPSQKIIAEVFDAGELVQKDLFIAYVFYRSAQKNGLDVAEQIEQIRSQLTPEQISEAENDIRQGKIINYYYRDIRKKKLPQHP